MSTPRKRREALVYHAKPRPGKIEVVPTKKHSSQRDLGLAYSPRSSRALPRNRKRINKNAYKYNQ